MIASEYPESKSLTLVEYIEVHISDETGERTESRPRFSVADPEANPTRAALAHLIIERRQSGRESLSRLGLSGAIAASDEFDRIEYPSVGNRQHYAMCLKGSRLTIDEANMLSGLTDHYDRLATQNAKRAA